MMRLKLIGKGQRSAKSIPLTEVLFQYGYKRITITSYTRCSFEKAGLNEQWAGLLREICQRTWNILEQQPFKNCNTQKYPLISQFPSLYLNIWARATRALSLISSTPLVARCERICTACTAHGALSSTCFPSTRAFNRVNTSTQATVEVDIVIC